jgi:hypothetical protein
MLGRELLDNSCDTSVAHLSTANTVIFHTQLKITLSEEKVSILTDARLRNVQDAILRRAKKLRPSTSATKNNIAIKIELVSLI